MKQPNPRLHPLTRHYDAEPLRSRADLPALTTRQTVCHPLDDKPGCHLMDDKRRNPFAAAHDFLVSNPRPDLTIDPRTLRMIEVS